MVLVPSPRRKAPDPNEFDDKKRIVWRGYIKAFLAYYICYGLL